MPVREKASKKTSLPKKIEAASGPSRIEHASEGGIDAVDRAFRVLRCFSDVSPVLTLTELSKLTDNHKSTILRITASLEAAGFIFRRPDKAYVLGIEAVRLGAAYARGFRLEDPIRPVLRQLQLETGESVAFYRREGDRRICLFREDSTRAIRHHVREGDVLDLGRGAAGRILVDFDPSLVAESLIAKRMRSLPVESFGEYDPEVAAIAVPIFSTQNALAGALSVTGPISRLTKSVLLGLHVSLLRSGQELSFRLGGGYFWTHHPSSTTSADKS